MAFVRTPDRNSKRSMENEQGSQGIGEMDLSSSYENKMDKCGLCFKCFQSGQNSLQCELCENWFHATCLGIKKNAFTVIGSSDNIPWFCRNCVDKQKKILGECKELRKENETLKQENVYLKDALSSIQEQMTRMKETIKEEVTKDIEALIYDNSFKRDLQKEIVKDCRKEIQTVVNEIKNQVTTMSTNNMEEIRGEVRAMVVEEAANNNSELSEQQSDRNIEERIAKVIRKEEEIKERMRNLVVFNMREPTTSNHWEKETEDRENVDRVIKEGVGDQIFNIVKTIRLGKLIPNSTRPRPLLVKLDNPGDKWRILKNSRNLRNKEDWMKQVGLAPDMTIEEREINRKLVEELKERKRNGETDIFISKGKICKKSFPMENGRRV